MKRGLALFLAALLTALALTACGGGGGYSGGSDSGAPAASESQTSYDYGASGGGENWKSADMEFGFDSPADAAAPEFCEIAGLPTLAPGSSIDGKDAAFPLAGGGDELLGRRARLCRGA